MQESCALTAIEHLLQGRLYGEDVEFNSVSTDSRQARKGSLFVALSGEHFDGHEFVGQAIENGACAAIVTRQLDLPVSQLKVTDTQLALGRLANFNRKQFHQPVLALTGSAGKTTTREMLAAILSEAGPVLASFGNFNNEIGVPLTLLELSPVHQFAVIEMGARKKSDIAYLMSIAEPDVTLITNAMPAHIEGFGSLENVASSKAEIFSELKSDGIAVINLDDQFAKLWLDMAGDRKVIGFSRQANANAIVSAELLESIEWGACIKLRIANDEAQIKLQVPGLHNLSNALAAAAGAFALGVDFSAICRGLEKFTGVSARLQLLAGMGACRIIDDSYNANPGSVKSAIDVLSGFAGSKWLLLGDMAELGTESQALHEQIADYAREKKIDALLCVGEKSKVAARRFGLNGRHFPSQEALLEFCRQSIRGNEVLLIKGSRSARMEYLVTQLTAAGEH
jgi:UDP-N-acetylmuramoyl-tripeptide--D-alanyl-D-alanine ligase